MPPINVQDPGVKPVGLFGIRGRNGSDPALAIPDFQVKEARNADFFQSSAGRRRGGADALAITGGTAFSLGVRSMFRHVPGFDQTLAEFWATDGAGLTKRLAGSVNWADVTFDDAISSDFGQVNAVSFNGKLLYLYNSTVNRSHYWDPVDAKVRQVGMTQATAPTVADTGAGTYAAVVRYYKVCYTKQSGGVTILRGNVSVATAPFTPSGAGTAARVTKPAAISNGETHWEIYGSPDDGDYFLITTLVVGTTTYDDSADPTTYDGDTPFDDGAFTPPPSARFGAADDARLILGGAWETSIGTGTLPTPRRIWWTSILGATDEGDDERISNTEDIKSYADIEEAVTAISKPIQGAFFVFSYDSQWKFVSTGVVNVPYLRYRVSGGAGCIEHKTVCVGDDEDGEPATYFVSYRGPMRISKDGQQWIGEDCLDIWARVNLDATSPFHSVFHPDIHQVWFHVAIDGSQTPNFRIKYDTRLGRFVSGSGGVRGGWTTDDGAQTRAYCSCTFSETVGASMGRKQKPYVGYVTSTAIWKCDTSRKDDNGVPFQAYIQSKPFSPWGLGRRGGMTQDALLVAAAAQGTRVGITLTRDEGAEMHTYSVDLSPTSDLRTETRVFPKIIGSQIAQCFTMSVTIGDIAPVAADWNIDAVILPVELEGT